MRDTPIGIRIPQPDWLIGGGSRRVVQIYDSHEPEQAFATSSPYIGDAYTETNPTHPDAASDFQVTLTGSSASLSWTQSPSGDVTDHWVFVDGGVESEGATSSANVTGVDTSAAHVFQVSALDDDYNFSPPVTLELSPLEVSLIDRDLDFIEVEVATPDPSLHTDIELYRATSQGGPYSKIETFSNPSSTQSFKDDGLQEGTTYYYEARAVTTNASTDVNSSEKQFATETDIPDSITFDRQGATGRSGPSSTNYSWESQYSKLSVGIVGNGKQEFQIPAGEGGTYRIEALGAEGGRDSGGGGEPGGAGARIEGEFQLNDGEILHILVGQRGTDGDGLGGGGGATHVAKYDPDTDTYTELISAGGGGAGGSYVGGDGEATLSNDDSGGNSCIGSAGFRGNSTVDQLDEEAKSFVNGGLGSQGDKGGGDGGFGGGAGSESDASGLNPDDDYGPGGGYQGRDGPCNQAVPGGFSYNDGTNQNNVTGDNPGHGEVKLIFPQAV